MEVNKKLDQVEIIDCYCCRDKGMEGGCQECGKEIVREVEYKKLPDSVSSIVPDFYRNNFWDKQKLFVTKEEYYRSGSNTRFLNFADQMEKVTALFKESYPRKSFILASFSKTSKTVFMMSCIQYAIKNNIDVSPILTIQEVKKYLYEGHKDKLSNTIMFIRIPDLFYKWGCDEIIREILVYRSLINKPTYIISDFPVKEIMPKKLESIVDYAGGDDPLRYPAILEYFE